MAKKRKKSKLASRKKFSFSIAIVLVVATLGYVGFHKFVSNAATSVTIRGTVVDQYGRAAAGITIACPSPSLSAATNGSGVFSMAVPTNTNGGPNMIPTFCLRAGGYARDYSGLVATNAGGPATYEWQVGGLYCYHNYDNCGPTNKPFLVPAQSLDADFPTTDTNYNFRVTYTDHTPPSAPSLRASVAGTSQINLSWTASTDVAPGYNGIAGYDVYRNGAKIASTGSTSFAAGGLAAGTTYSFYVRARDGSQNQSAPSNTAAATTNRPSGGGGGNTGGGGTVKPKPSGGTSSGGTTTQQGSGGTLTAPTNLTANTNVVGVVLNWSLSSGGTGDISYQIDRSTNGTDWQSVSSSVFGSSYADTTASYNASYTYRVRASDSTGAVSDYVTATVTTGSYSATPGNTISSDDGNVTATIADGAVDKDSACAIVNQSETQPISNPSAPIVQGPYLLICRNANGDVINEFKGNVDIAIKLTSESRNGHGNFKITEIQPDSTDWQNVDSKYNSKDKTITFTTTKASTFAVTAQKQANILRYVLIGLLVAGIGFVLFMIIKRKDTIIEWFYRH